jgi:hypothetical protein
MVFAVLLAWLVSAPLSHVTIHLDDYSRAKDAGRVVFTQQGHDVAVHIQLSEQLAGDPVHYRLYRRHAAHTVLTCGVFYNHAGTSFDPADPTPADAELPLDRDLGASVGVVHNVTIADLRRRDGVIAVWTPHDVVCGDL